MPVMRLLEQEQNSGNIVSSHQMTKVNSHLCKKSARVWNHEEVKITNGKHAVLNYGTLPVAGIADFSTADASSIVVKRAITGVNERNLSKRERREKVKTIRLGQQAYEKKYGITFSQKKTMVEVFDEISRCWK